MKTQHARHRRGHGIRHHQQRFVSQGTLMMRSANTASTSDKAMPSTATSAENSAVV
jgi:hypothetical protein